MEKLLKTIANSSTDQKALLLPQALEYRESGIDFLIECLDDAELEIRATAYQLLLNIESQKVKQAITPGFLLNPGDKIYYVLERDVYFDDSFYRLYPSVNINKIKDLVTYDDYRDRNYKVISFGDIAYITAYTFTNCYFNFQQAELKAESLRRKIIQKRSITEFNLRHDRETVKQWCDRHQITKEVNNFKLDRSLEQRWREQIYFFDIPNSNDYIDWFRVEEYLKYVQNYALLNQLWQDLVGYLAGIQEIIFNKQTYLGINNYYSQLKKHIKHLNYADYKNSLYSEEAEINLLLTALNNSKLEIKNLAYQLLQGIDSEKARQAIYQGVRLKPGDVIYSVYQSGISYTDEIFYLLWDDVDYLEQLRYQIEGSFEGNLMECSKRIYCYMDRKQAEEAAEDLHRHLIKETNISFEWRKENPNFDAKQWCIDNDFYYKTEWDNLSDYETVWAIKDLIWLDDKLLDSFRRSRYIYHPKHIDTWCKDNQIEYDRNLDNWDNYRRLLDYLDLPENIELLSKFWKDGTGHLAFVKEEIVQQTAYVKIGKKLDRELGEDKVFAVPKEFEAKAAKLLVEIIDRQSSERKTRSKARKMLQENDWDEIPF